MAQLTVTVSARVAWWLAPLAAVLRVAARLGWMPSDAAIHRICRRAVSVRVC